MKRKMINKTCPTITHKYAAKATAIVLVVVLLALLAIMGMSFVVMSRVENVAAKNQATGVDLTRPTNDVINVIQSTLADDIWGRPEDQVGNGPGTMHNSLTLLGLPTQQGGTTTTAYTGTFTAANPSRNEPWDAPTGPGGTATYYYYDGALAYRDIPVDGDPWLADSTIANGNQMTNLFGPARLLYGAATADADGNGQPPAVPFDSVRVPLPGNPVTGPGIRYFAAVRIVDACGMVNMNTAWSVPSEYAGQPARFPGNVLSGIRLYDLTIPDPHITVNPPNIPAFGYAGPIPGKLFTPATSTLSDMLDFENNYIFRVESPNWANLGNFAPLDFSDEFSLRNHWNQDDESFVSSFELDTDNNFAATPERFANLRADQNPNCGDSRQLLTTYNFTRDIRRIPTTGNKPLTIPWNLDDLTPNIQNRDGRTGANRNGIPRKKNLDLAQKIWRNVQVGTYRPREIQATAEGRALPSMLTADQEFVASLYGAFYAGRLHINPADAQSFASRSTVQYLANLVDYFDEDTNPTVLNVPAVNGRLSDPVLPDWNPATYGTLVFGNEPHLVISEVYYYVDTLQNTPNAHNTYFAIEIYNPWRDITFENTPADRYTVFIISSSGTVKTPWPVFLPRMEPGNIILAGSAPPIVPGVNLPTPAINLGGIILEPGDQIILLHSTNGAPLATMAPVDKFSIPANPIPNTPILMAPGVSSTATRFSDIDYRRYTVDAITFDPGFGNNGILCDWAALSDEHEPCVARTDDTPNYNASIPHTLGAFNDNAAAAPANLKISMPYKVRRSTAASPLSDQIMDESLVNFGEVSLIWYEGVATAGATQDIETPAQLIQDYAGREENLRPAFHIADQYGRYFKEFFTLLSRDDDGTGQIVRTQYDSLNEQRLPGLVNINTAPITVIQGLQGYLTQPRATAIANGVAPRPKPYASSYDILNHTTIAELGNPASAADEPDSIQGVRDDLEETQLIWSRCANLITNRSDTFIAYILTEARDEPTPANPLGNLLGQRREVVLFDRSLCNQPPLIWNATAAPPRWEPNPNYVAPKVVARQVVE